MQTSVHCYSQLVVDAFWDVKPVQFVMQQVGLPTDRGRTNFRVAVMRRAAACSNVIPVSK